MPATTFEGALEQVCADVPELKESFGPATLASIESDLRDLRDNPGARTAGGDSVWAWIAAEGLSGSLEWWDPSGGVANFADVYDEALAHVQEVVLAKQHDYGHQNILWGGAAGVVLRCHDKVARINNLLLRGEDPSNESLEDSWLDIVGYALIGMMLERGTFELPLAADVEPAVISPLVPGDEREVATITDTNGHKIVVTATNDHVHVATKASYGLGGAGPFLDDDQFEQLCDALHAASVLAGWDYAYHE